MYVLRLLTDASFSVFGVPGTAAGRWYTDYELLCCEL